jgi:hypothetical protein
MDAVLTIVLVWLCLTSGSVYTQTKSCGHLLASLGAALVLLSLLFKANPYLARVTGFAGEAIFMVGLAVIWTFGRVLETERLRTSSWKEILLGNVPEHLQVEKVSEKSQLIGVILISLLFAVAFYLAGDHETAFVFLIGVIVFVAYLTFGKPA